MSTDAKEWESYTYVDGRKRNKVGETDKASKVFPMEVVLKTIFEPQDEAIIETNDDTETLGLNAVVRFMEEMVSTANGKVTRHFMSVSKPQSLSTVVDN